MPKQKYPDLKNQQSASKTFNVGDELSDDGMLWIQDALGQLSDGANLNNPYESRLVVTQKFKITITKL